ncbi:S1 RNA-binding domain-containing protein, partial [bacterium]
EKYMSGDFGAAEAGETGFERPQKGKRYEATIIQVEDDKVFVSLGAGKAEGIIPLSELSEENLSTAKGHFNTGDKINVIVLRTEGADGNPIVSKKRADFEEVWDRIEEAHRSGTSLSAPVVDRVKGGLVVDVGVRGFVPATHVGSGKLRNIEKYVGETLELKVIEIDRDRKKVVLSNREAEEQRRTSAKDEIFNNVKPGDILEGTVRRLTDYGAFVDLGGVDGLLHISEMSWARINHPKEVFKEGQKIKVMVLRLDKDNGKISLGHRQVLPDPWKEIGEKYRNGQKLTVSITRLVQSGGFIRLPEGAEAFMPVSEMSPRRIKRPQDVVEEGQDVECQIIDLRPEERRMVLSMKAVGGGMELRPGATEAPADFRPAGARGGRGGRDGGFEDFGGARRGFATGGATIGDRLAALKQALG